MDSAVSRITEYAMTLEERQERGRRLLDDMLGPSQAEKTREIWRGTCATPCFFSR